MQIIQTILVRVICITVEAEFNQALYDTLNPDDIGFVPAETVLEIANQQKVEVRDVFGPNDLNFVDGENDLVWVLANAPNDNRIFTSVGDDTVFGGLADDTINTGLGNDILYGNTGDDNLVGGGGNDTLVGGEGNDTIQGGAGVDTVDFSDTDLSVKLNLGEVINGFSVAFIDEGGVDAETDNVQEVENVVTGDGADELTGDLNTNILSSGAGNDSLFASLGADVLDGGLDIDTVDFSSLNGSVNFVSLVLDTVNDAIVTVDGASNQTIRNVENVTGTDGDDVISGDSNQNIIMGGSGNDTLSGRGGIDELDGGDGNDTVDYYAADGSVNVSLLDNEASNDGDSSTDNFTSIENVSGSAHNDIIAGDNDVNILFGAGGNDTISGAGGDDIFLASLGADTLDGQADVDTVDYSVMMS